MNKDNYYDYVYCSLIVAEELFSGSYGEVFISIYISIIGETRTAGGEVDFSSENSVHDSKCSPCSNWEEKGLWIVLVLLLFVLCYCGGSGGDGSDGDDDGDGKWWW